MFSACSIPNTDISLDQNSGSKLELTHHFKVVFIFFLVLHHDAYFSLAFGHSLLLSVRLPKRQKLKLKNF